MRWQAWWTARCQVSTGQHSAACTGGYSSPLGCQLSRRLHPPPYAPAPAANSALVALPAGLVLAAAVAVMDSLESGRLIGSLSMSDLRGILPAHFEQLAEPVGEFLAGGGWRDSPRGWGGAPAPPLVAWLLSLAFAPQRRCRTRPPCWRAPCGAALERYCSSWQSAEYTSCLSPTRRGSRLGWCLPLTSCASLRAAAAPGPAAQPSAAPPWNPTDRAAGMCQCFGSKHTVFLAWLTHLNGPPCQPQLRAALASALTAVNTGHDVELHPCDQQGGSTDALEAKAWAGQQLR